MDQSDCTILIVGSGSVGKRHARNLYKLGYDLSCVDPRSDRRNEMSGEVPLKGDYANLKEALASGSQYRGAIVCSPPKFHVDHATQLLKCSIPVMLEKPVSKTLRDTVGLQRIYGDCEKHGGPYLLLGYSWRWWPALQYVRRLVGTGAIGIPYYVNFLVSAHLEDWHPWENYRDFFMASSDLGGGALLDESHWIDQMIWLFGMPNRVFGTVSTVSDMEITSDDSVELLAIYKNGLKVTMHLDIFGRPHEKSLHIIGSGGVIKWNEDRNSVTLNKGTEEVVSRQFSEERNYMFIEIAREFEHVMAGGQPKTCKLRDGLNVLRVVEAIRRSNQDQCLVEIKDI